MSNAITLLIALFGLLLLILACQRLYRARFLAAGGSAVAGLVLLGIAALLFVVSLNLHTYARLTYERPIAEIVFEARGPQQFRATLAQVPSGEMQLFMLSGDEWQDRKSTRLNSSHVKSSYAVFCLKTKR